MVSLNSKRPFNQIYGTYHGARYVQKDLFFDEQSELIPDHPAYGPEQKERAAALMAKEKVAPKGAAPVEEEEDDEEFFAGRNDPDEDEDEDESPPPKAKASPPNRPAPKVPAVPPVKTEVKTVGQGIDLKLWALGKKSYNFIAVREEIKRKYSFHVTDKRSAINMLVDEGVVKEKDIPKG